MTLASFSLAQTGKGRHLEAAGRELAVMRKKKAWPGLAPRALCLLLTLLAGSATSETGRAEDPPTASPKSGFIPGVVVTFQLQNVKPDTQLTLEWKQAWFLGTASALHRTPAAALAGLHLEGNTLRFAPPPGSLPDHPATLEFTTLMELASGAGSSNAQPPLVLVLKEEWGTLTTRGGPFELPLPPIPPTCSIVNCMEMPRACKKTHDPEDKKCYFSQGMDYCCSIPPEGSILKP